MQPPRGIPDLGADVDQRTTRDQLRRLEESLRSRFPRFAVNVRLASAPDPAMRPVGYDCGLVSVYASENQPEAALEEARRVMERILTDTELEQTQPGSGSPYLISDDRSGPTPVRQTARDGSTRIVGWEWLVYVAPSLASAQACEEVLAIRTRRTEH